MCGNPHPHPPWALLTLQTLGESAGAAGSLPAPDWAWQHCPTPEQPHLNGGQLRYRITHQALRFADSGDKRRDPSTVCTFLVLARAEQPAEATALMAEVFLAFILALISKPGTAGASVLHFESKPGVNRVLDHFCHKIEGCSKVTGVHKNLLFSEMSRVCRHLSLNQA